MECRSVRAGLRSAPGFTLLELAVVVVVVTILLGTVLVPLSAQVQQRNVSQTQRVLEETRDALIGFAMIHGRLPRPATSATDGSERLSPCTTDAECTGFIPWATLGTPAADAWGKLYRYSVTPTLAVKGGFNLATNGNKTVRSRDATGTPIWLVRSSPVPAVIFSQGANNFGTTRDGVALGSTSDTNLDEADNQNNDGTRPYWARTSSSATGSPGGEFDDQVVWIPTALLFGRMVQAGQLP
jgi:prepilin-type N-terminal cleavage/methylation domain-containing protein